jgi:hypothetical protein
VVTGCGVFHLTGGDHLHSLDEEVVQFQIHEPQEILLVGRTDVPGGPNISGSPKDPFHLPHDILGVGVEIAADDPEGIFSLDSTAMRCILRKGFSWGRTTFQWSLMGQRLRTALPNSRLWRYMAVG